MDTGADFCFFLFFSVDGFVARGGKHQVSVKYAGDYIDDDSLQYVIIKTTVLTPAPGTHGLHIVP